MRTALAPFNDVILREATAHGLSVLDLRLVCDEPGDYSTVSPIEPSAQGGRKIDAWYTALKVVEVSFDEQADAFRNINTLEELKGA